MPRTCTVCRHAERDDIETDLRAGTSYRDIARRRSVSKDTLSRHRANHMSRHTATGLAAGKEIMTILNRAETAVTWNSTLLTIREARRYVEELMMLKLDGAGVSGGCAGPERKMKKQTVGFWSVFRAIPVV